MAGKCSDNCQARGFAAWLDSPVLPSEVAARQAEDERFRELERLARGKET